MSSNITVAYREMPSFFEIPKDGPQKPVGVEGILLITLMETLGLNYNLVSNPDYKTGRVNENGSWTGTVGLVQRGDADIGMASTTQTYDRSEVVDFTVPYLFSSVNFVTELPQMLPRVHAYVRPFDKATWASLFSAIFVLPMVFVALFRNRHFSKEWLNMFGNVLGRSVPQKISGPSQALFLVFWWFATMIIFFGYSSLFFSCLSVPPRSVPPKDFHQLAQAVEEGEYKVFSPRVSTVRSLLESYRSARQVESILAAIERNDWFFDPRNYWTLAIADKTAFIGSALHNRMIFGKAPYLTKYQSEGMILFYCGIAVNKGLPDLKAKLDRLLLRAHQAGLVEKYMQDAYFRTWVLTYDEESSSQLLNPLSFDELYGAFLILVGGWFLSGFVLILEWSYKKSNRTNNICSDMHFRF